MTIIFLVRHAETEWSKSRSHRFRGRADIPLNEKGIQQAKALGKQLSQHPISAIYSSPLIRALDTAKEIARFHELPVQDYYDFIDLDFGTWEGRLHAEIASEQPKLYENWKSGPSDFRFPEGESLDELRSRIGKALIKLTKLHYNDSIVISTHGAVLRIALCFISNADNSESWNFNMDNCAFTKIIYLHGKFSIDDFNNNTHLKEIKI
jgi:broad specificity phosphatase PhoE